MSIFFAGRAPNAPSGTPACSRTYLNGAWRVSRTETPFSAKIFTKRFTALSTSSAVGASSRGRRRAGSLAPRGDSARSFAASRASAASSRAAVAARASATRSSYAKRASRNQSGFSEPRRTGLETARVGETPRASRRAPPLLFLFSSPNNFLGGPKVPPGCVWRRTATERTCTVPLLVSAPLMGRHSEPFCICGAGKCEKASPRAACRRDSAKRREEALAAAEAAIAAAAAVVASFACFAALAIACDAETGAAG
mmetsp:Transcript_12086/g.51905  ORF Transcript_12086/g.51905 Transcript_12086/m.51905 type:complete len:254 (+) Transcript_12086:666-1427(+)